MLVNLQILYLKYCLESACLFFIDDIDWKIGWVLFLFFFFFQIFTISKLGCSPRVLAHTAKWAVHHHELSQSVNTHRCWISTLVALTDVTDMIWINDWPSFNTHMHERKTTTKEKKCVSRSGILVLEINDDLFLL